MFSVSIDPNIPRRGLRNGVDVGIDRSITRISEPLSTYFYGFLISAIVGLLTLILYGYGELVVVFLPFIDAICFGMVLVLVGQNRISSLTAKFTWVVFLLWSTGAAFIISWKYLRLGQSIWVKGGEWLRVGNLDLHFGFLYDGLTVNMLLVVFFISAVVKCFAFGYMREDPNFFRFLSYLSFFTAFMVVLVTADNFIQLFLGWEGVGLCSYLLISFWTTRVQAVKAALKAISVNRISDCSFLFALLFVYLEFESFHFIDIFATAHLVAAEDVFYIDVITLFLIIGAAGKSAQLGFHVWLPDAMEGPTPVSALIHAATMVTAGVFLLVRCSPIIEYSSCLDLLTFWGGLTAFFGATVALFQYDMKKIIAYSTCSQLGYMFFACGTSNYIGAMYHLTTHAFFKALLFLAAGAVIHSFSDEQDIRKFSGVSRFLPLVYLTFLLGSLALMGFPFFSGFYSKEYILQYGYLRGFYVSYFLVNVAALFTCFYSTKLIYYVFFNTVKAVPCITDLSDELRSSSSIKDKHFSFVLVHQLSMSKTMYKNFHRPSYWIYIPLCILAIMSIFIGYFLSDIYIGLDNFFFCNSIFVLSEHRLGIAVESEMPLGLKVLPLLYIAVSFGFLICYRVYLQNQITKIILINKNIVRSYTKTLSIILSKFFVKLFFLYASCGLPASTYLSSSKGKRKSSISSYPVRCLTTGTSESVERRNNSGKGTESERQRETWVPRGLYLIPIGVLSHLLMLVLIVWLIEIKNHGNISSIVSDEFRPFLGMGLQALYYLNFGLCIYIFIYYVLRPFWNTTAGTWEGYYWNKQSLNFYGKVIGFLSWLLWWTFIVAYYYFVTITFF
jgi:proton-translocating NADH-quinone oxidoreductase chain L